MVYDFAHDAFYPDNGTEICVWQQDRSEIVDYFNICFIPRQKKWWSYGDSEMWNILFPRDQISWSTFLIDESVEILPKYMYVIAT